MSPRHAAIAAQRPRRRPRPKSRCIAPSQALLSILASITPSPTAAAPCALPTPDFLCPALTTIPPRSIRKRAPYHFAGADAASIPTATADVPVKYVEAQDGNWYPATGWSLHGKSKHQLPALSSTSTASTSAPARTRPPGLDIADDIADIPTSSSSSTSNSTALPDITDSLPTGWKPTPSRTKFYSEPLIVGFSIVLAVTITLCLAAAVLWHRNRSAARDVEKARLRKQLRADADEDDDDADRAEELLRAVQEAQAKKVKLWTRWRREARIGLRRRRRIRQPDAQPPGVEEEESRASTSRRASVVSARSDISIPIPATSTADPPPSPPPPRTPPLPPAYRRRSRTDRTKDEGSARWPIVLPPDPDDEVPTRPSTPDEEPPTVSAHIATDDKAVLERMRHQASEPQLGDAHADEETGAEAPRWEDEQLEDFEDADADASPSPGPSTAPHPGRPFPPPRPFHLRLPSPPPPAPALLSEPGSDGEGGDPSLPYYAPRFDVPGPSSPPYELDEAAVMPSAPPPPEEEEEGEEEEEILAPSAPPLESEDEEGIEDVNAEGGEERGRERERERGAARSDHTPPTSRSASPSRCTSPSASHAGSASNVVLPRYEP